ncbi:DUF4142 domain-containing protein [Chryseobacterium wangxinyae]|uniref:DUF4142 domain-containing protein n=1 Tax=Chryseobacterium sp. CY350 TaxID=2997336 RepID=UPI00226ED8FC|nr:DUF4142 domain-containing protein [Chryseobacterium sp. CY350]MCY0977317.1 DUF4142 domain-containing protein [Chryseobacterium sp. CY350]WBZ95664.1 DUF4142 domain-containing protein [Chryseobacterium sp. CY350]
MKKTIVMLLAITCAVACSKNKANEPTNHPADHTEMSSSSNPAASTADSVEPSQTSPGDSLLSDQDKRFADAAAKGGMMEVMTGELAIKKGNSQTVKSLGQMMVKDHTKANNELKQWASAHSYTLPASLDASQQKKYDELQAAKGAEFDRLYTNQMVIDHQKTIADFRQEVAQGSEKSLKEFAGKKIPALEHHLMESEKAKEAVK